MPPKRIEKLKAKVFEINGNFVKISYPIELFEEGSLPNLLSGIAGNIFGMKAVKNLRLMDAEFSKEYFKYFRGATFGFKAIKEIFKKKEGPIVASVPKPKVGYTSENTQKLGICFGEMDLIGLKTMKIFRAKNSTDLKKDLDFYQNIERKLKEKLVK
jgi:ribulose 1,5-bisphosphate carboxylase large subunit-like protein